MIETILAEIAKRLDAFESHACLIRLAPVFWKSAQTIVQLHG
jgi:hypothetical protein